MSRTGHVEDGLPGVSYINKFLKNETLESIAESADKRIGMQITPIEGRLVFTLLRMIEAKNVVEIGSLVGYSSIWIAKAISGMLYSIDISPENCILALENHAKAGLSHKIIQIEGDARLALESLSTHGPFDAIFIDGDKGGYCDYLDWADDNIRMGGLILADNVLLRGSVYADEPPQGVSEKSWRAMRQFNDRVMDSTKYDSAIVPIFDGLVVARKRFG